MICPHWGVGIHEDWKGFLVGEDRDGAHRVQTMKCPECKRLIVRFRSGTKRSMGGLGSINPLGDVDKESSAYVVHPYGGSRPVSSDVPPDLAKDFREAVAVLPSSPAASAALSRRCMRNAIRQVTGLYDEIEEVIAQGRVPSWLADQLHEARKIGNIVAHPIEGSSAGTILAVESGEAEWNLAVVENLFDHFYSRRRRQRDEKLTFRRS